MQETFLCRFFGWTIVSTEYHFRFSGHIIEFHLKKNNFYEDKRNDRLGS